MSVLGERGGACFGAGAGMEGHNLVGGACFVVFTQWTEVLASYNHFNSSLLRCSIFTLV